jgi:N-acetylglucosaminyldiphosphoundecaprenol N-acetyl-beta-D-mannosaminyltransferase
LAASPARYNVVGVGVSELTLARARDLIVGAQGTTRRGYVCCGTAHGLVEAGRDPALRRAFNGSWFTTPDGMPLVWLGPAGVERVYGPDLMLAVCDAGRAAGVSHYFFGGGSGVDDELATRLQARFPGLKVAGTFTPPYRPMTPDELAAWRAEIARLRPDVIWVGLGTPKQELFMAAHGPTLDAGVLIGGRRGVRLPCGPRAAGPALDAAERTRVALPPRGRAAPPGRSLPEDKSGVRVRRARAEDRPAAV